MADAAEQQARRVDRLANQLRRMGAAVPPPIRHEVQQSLERECRQLVILRRETAERGRLEREEAGSTADDCPACYSGTRVAGACSYSFCPSHTE